MAKSTQQQSAERELRRIEKGCGAGLLWNTVTCGKLDKFGTRQYCHTCNVALYQAKVNAGEFADASVR